MIDTTKFTDEQQWGLAFVTQQHNATNPDDQVTPEQYAERILRAACNSYWMELVEHKKALTVEAFNSAPPEKQEQVFQILGVGNVVE
jgi:hypothetical protein